MSKSAITKMQAIILLVIAIVAAVLAVSYYYMSLPPPKEEEKVIEIEMWDGITGGEGWVIDTLLEQFQNYTKGRIKVNEVPIPWSDLYTKLTAAYKAGSGLPDVVLMHRSEYPLFAGTACIALDDYINSPDGFIEEDFAPGVWELMHNPVDGKIYGIAWDMHGLGLYVNLDVLEKAGMTLNDLPKNHEEFIEWGLKIKEKTGAYATINGWSEWPWGFFQCVLSQRRIDWYIVRDGKYYSNWNDSRIIEALRWLRSLVELGLTPSQATWEEVDEMFISGKAATVYFGTWLQATYDRASGLNYTIYREGFDEMPGTLIGIHMWFLTGANGKERTDAAWELIRFMCRSEINGQWGQYGGHVPAIAEAQKYPPYANNPKRSAFAKYFAKCAEAGTLTMGLVHLYAGDVNDVINSNLISLMQLQKTPEEVAATIHESVQKIFDERFNV
jgi:multiple sugar transport system substrate-binding protein